MLQCPGHSKWTICRLLSLIWSIYLSNFNFYTGKPFLMTHPLGQYGRKGFLFSVRKLQQIKYFSTTYKWMRQRNSSVLNSQMRQLKVLSDNLTLSIIQVWIRLEKENSPSNLIQNWIWKKFSFECDLLLKGL